MLSTFDTHFHIINPDFPLVENNGYMPEPFTVDEYLYRVRALNIQGGAVVSGSFQAFDQGYLRDALAQLGPSFVGVTQIPANTSDTEILKLHDDGVRAIRFNVARGGSEGLDDLDALAQRVYDLVGWHTELYIDARSIDETLIQRLSKLPAVSIDHLGMHKCGIDNLLRLVESGVKVKATGFGRITLDPSETMRRIVEVSPRALMVGTDLPSTRADRPFEDSDFTLIQNVLDSETAQRVFWNNAAEFYLGSPDATSR